MQPSPFMYQFAVLLAIRAGNKLNNIKVESTKSREEPEVSSILQQVIYEVTERNRLEKHQDSVWNVSFSPDGKQIVTASLDNTAKVWNGVDTNLDRLIKRGCDMMCDYLTTNPNAKEEDRQMCGIVKH